jgi:hypothetical protein
MDQGRDPDPDPDPHQNFTDPQNCFIGLTTWIFSTFILVECRDGLRFYSFSIFGEYAELFFISKVVEQKKLSPGYIMSHHVLVKI